MFAEFSNTILNSDDSQDLFDLFYHTLDNKLRLKFRWLPLSYPETRCRDGAEHVIAQLSKMEME